MGRTITFTPNGKEKPDVRKKSILKRGETPHSSQKTALNSLCSGGVKSVKFKKSKDVEQMKLRVKLNTWLESKGKTPSRCRHLMCFDEELSAKKKRSDVLQGRMSGDLLGKQEKALNREQASQSVRKNLFKENRVSGSMQPIKHTPNANPRKYVRTSIPVKKEKTPSRTSVDLGRKRRSDGSMGKAFSDTTNKVLKSPHPISSTKLEEKNEVVCEQSCISKSNVTPVPVQNYEPQITDEDIQENLKSMLQECLTLLRAGCPADNIIPWLENMEQYIPQTLTSASFYACKAEVFAGNPLKMLEVFCQGIENKAEPNQILTEAMRQLLTPHLSSNEDEDSLPLSHPLKSSPLCSKKDVQCIGQDLMTSDEYLTNDTTMSKDGSNMKHCDVDSSTRVYTGIEHVPSSKTKTPVKGNQSSYDDPESDDHRSTSKYTPVREMKTNENSSSQFGSTIKYSVSTVTPIPGQSPELVSRSLVTPVRRSVRLSNRHPTPQALHEIDSVSDLTLREAETTMYLSNPAIQEN